MQSIKANNYFIHFQQKGYKHLTDYCNKHQFSKIFILVDEHTNEYCLPIFLPNLATEIPLEIIEIEAGEHHKNIETCLEIWQVLNDLGGDRKSLLINVGGGVLTDLGGFVASTFKRGISFINVPTTLLGMVDAAIGGKNGIDFNGIKNQIGVIQAPAFVLVDTQFLETLPGNQMRSGLAEMLKHGLIFDKNYWNELKDLSQVTTNDLDQLIHRSIEIKNEIVCQDLTENGIRKSLNFGHTLGHAIESYFLENPNKPELLHGEAVAIGMILASYLSVEKNTLTEADYLEVSKIILNTYPKIEFTTEDISEIIKLLIFDKKNEYGKVLFVLLDGIGATKINQIINNDLIFKAFNSYSNLNS